MAWKVVSRSKHAQSKVVDVGINERGFSPSPASYKLLEAIRGKRSDTKKGPMHVELLHDDARQAVGIRAAAPGPNTYRVVKHPNAESYRITCKAFLRESGIDLKPRRIAATMEDDILVILVGETKETKKQKKD